MENKPLRIIQTVIKWVTLAVIILTLAVAAVKCLKIYSCGEGEYSREAVASAILELSPLVYICFLTVFSGLMIGIIVPEQKYITTVSNTYKLFSYKNRYELVDEYAEKAEKEEKLRGIYKIVFAVLSVIAFGFPFIYLLNKSNFTVENLNSDVIAATIAVLIPAAFVFMFSLMRVYLCSNSEKREVDIFKNAIISGKAMKTEKSAVKHFDYTNHLRVAIICISVILIVMGIFNDGIGDVYGKAVRICTECIGLG